MTWGASLALCLLFLITAIPAPLVLPTTNTVRHILHITYHTPLTTRALTSTYITISTCIYLLLQSVSVSAFVLYSLATRVMEIIVAVLMLTPFTVHEPEPLLKTLPGVNSGVNSGEKSGEKSRDDDEEDNSRGGSRSLVESVVSVSSPLHHEINSPLSPVLLPTMAMNQSKSRSKHSTPSKYTPWGVGKDNNNDEDNDYGKYNDNDKGKYIDNNNDKGKYSDRRWSGEDSSVVSSMTGSMFASRNSERKSTKSIKQEQGQGREQTRGQGQAPGKGQGQVSGGWFGSRSPTPIVPAAGAALREPISLRDSLSTTKSASKGQGWDIGASLRSSSSQTGQSNLTAPSQTGQSNPTAPSQIGQSNPAVFQEPSWDERSERSERSKVSFSIPMTRDVRNGSNVSNSSNGGSGSNGINGNRSSGSNGSNGSSGQGSKGRGSSGSNGTTPWGIMSKVDISKASSDHYDNPYDTYNPWSSHSYAPPSSPSQQLTQRRRSSSGDGLAPESPSPRSPIPSSPRPPPDSRYPPPEQLRYSPPDALRYPLFDPEDNGKPSPTTIAVGGMFDYTNNQDQMSISSRSTGRGSRASAVLTNIADYYPQSADIEGNLLSLHSTRTNSSDVLPSYHSTVVPVRSSSVSSPSPNLSSSSPRPSSLRSSQSLHLSQSSPSSHSSHSTRRQGSNHNSSNYNHNSSNYKTSTHSPRDTIPTDPTDTIPTPLPVDQVRT